eukprot:911756-Rhodomonas_salina.1
MECMRPGSAMACVSAAIAWQKQAGMLATCVTWTGRPCGSESQSAARADGKETDGDRPWTSAQQDDGDGRSPPHTPSAAPPDPFPALRRAASSCPHGSCHSPIIFAVVLPRP